MRLQPSNRSCVSRSKRGVVLFPVGRAVAWITWLTHAASLPLAQRRFVQQRPQSGLMQQCLDPAQLFAKQVDSVKYVAS